MQEFKAGDLVEVIQVDEGNWFRLGEVYKVRMQKGNEVYVNSVEGEDYESYNPKFDDNCGRMWIDSKRLMRILPSNGVTTNIVEDFSEYDREIIGHMIQQYLAQAALEETVEGFEVGDVVEVTSVDENNWYQIGEVYEVRGFDQLRDAVFVRGVEGNYYHFFHPSEDDTDDSIHISAKNLTLKKMYNFDPEVIAHRIQQSLAQTALQDALEETEEETPEVKMIVDLQQIKEASEFCATFNPYVHEDAEFFEQEIFSAIERYEDGKTYTAIYGFYVLFEKEFDDVVFVNVLVDPRLGMSGEYTEATLKDGILVKGF